MNATLRSHDRRLDPRASLLFLALWTALMVHNWGAGTSRDSTQRLGDPAATANRLTGRALDLADAIEAAPASQRRFWQQIEATPSESLPNAIAILDDVIAMLEERGREAEANHWPAIDIARVNLAVLLAESAEVEEACAVARLIEGIGDYCATIRHAYESAPLSEIATPVSALVPVLEDWPEQHLRLRLAERSGDAEQLARLQSALAQRGQKLFRGTSGLFLANWGLVAIGLLVLVVSLVRGRAGPTAPSPPAPWSLEDGLGVLIRGDTYNHLYYLFLGELPEAIALSPVGHWLWEFAMPLASLPLLWLVWRHLLSPNLSVDADPFGLNPSRLAWTSIAGVTLSAIAIELLGTQALGWGAYFLELYSPWSEGFDETLVFASRRELITTSLDYIFWVPAIEELSFRGLLFFSLRKRLSVTSATLLSTVLFSAVHFYSLPGFVVTLFGGVVWAIVFERTRSLLPGITAHAVWNGLFVAGLLLLYR